MDQSSSGSNYAVSVVVIATSAVLVWGAASLPAPESRPQWAPFVAKSVQESTQLAPNGMAIHLSISAVFARNSEGSSFHGRSTLSVVESVPGPVWQQGDFDMATLHDRPNNTIYEIDFSKKTIKKRSASANVDDFPLEPFSRGEFDKKHAADLFLGRKIRAGVECEGYKLGDPTRKSQHPNEVWHLR